MLLEKLIIKNFKGINEKQEIDFSTSNKPKEKLKNNLMFKKEGNSLIPLISGFMGKNASGKTSILDAIKFTINFTFNINNLFNHFYSRKIFLKEINNQKLNFNINSISENNNLKNKIVKNNRLINNFLQLTLENKIKLFPDEYNSFLKETFESNSHDQKKPIEIKLIFKNKNDIYKIKLNLKKKNLSNLTYENDQQIENEIFPLIKFYTLEFYNNRLEMEEVLRLQWKLIELIGHEKYNLILRMIDNNIERIDKKINNSKKIEFNNICMNNKTIIPFENLSTGTIKILKFIAIIMIEKFNPTLNSIFNPTFNPMKKSLTIFIADEINNFLHTKLIHFLFNLLSKNSYNFQLLFTTHSPSVMENLDRHAVWVIQNEDHLKIKKVGSILREDNNFYKKFIKEEISSHPSNSEINEVLYELSKK